MSQMLDKLRERGYAVRQHLPEESWTRRKRTVVDLDDRQRSLLETEGPASLVAALEAEDSWTFPAFDIDAPAPRAAGVDLVRERRVVACVVVASGDPELADLAAGLVSEVSHRHGIDLPIRSDGEIERSALGKQPLVLVGGSDRNRLSLAFALHYQDGPQVTELQPGLHILSDTDIDDPTHPRVERVKDVLDGRAWAGWAAARAGLEQLMADHAVGRPVAQQLCRHGDVAGTVSSSLIALGVDRLEAAHFLFAPGSPCAHPYQDLSPLLRAGPP